MACKIQYLKDKFTGIELDIAASLHQQIERELNHPDIHKFKGAYYEFTTNGPANIARVNRSRKLIGEINDKYNGKVITILPTREYRINVLPVVQYYIDKETNQQALFQTSSNTVSKKNQELDNLLKEYCTINGIHLEYLSSLLDKFGGDYTAVYFRGIKQIISINEGREKKDTLAEEVSHSVVESLGDEDFLVKKALNLIGKTDYKSTLDPQYIKLYKNNEVALKKEYLGKLMAETLVNRFEPKDATEITLLDTILKLWNKFINLFKPNDRSEQLETIVNQLVEKVANKEKIVITGEDMPEDTMYFQVNDKSGINPEYKKQYVYFKRRIGQLSTEIQKYEIGSKKYEELNDELTDIKTALEELKVSDNKQIVIDLGDKLLNKIEKDFITMIESPSFDLNKLKPKNLFYAANTLKAFITLPNEQGIVDLTSKASKLYKRLKGVIEEFSILEANKYNTGEEDITIEKIDNQTKDINRFIKSFGALADSANILARTIAAMIKAAQNKISTMNKKIADIIEKEVDALRDYSKINGISEDNMYDIFIQEYKDTTVLTKEYTTEWYDEMQKHQGDSDWWNRNAVKVDDVWKPISSKYDNPNYKTIQKTPELKRFYDFHKELVRLAATKLPRKLGENFIANIKDVTLLDSIKSAKTTKGKFISAVSHLTDVDVNVFDNRKITSDEDLFSDTIPVLYTKKIKASEKSKDLGSNLLTFVSFANSYAELNDVLPAARLLQEQIGTKTYTKSSDPSVNILGEESNIYNLVKTVIDMQVKGETKKDEAKIKIENVYDEEGNKIGEKYIHGSQFLDFGLRYNSLLRIGFNPFNAVANVLVGDIGNTIEAFGGRFYGIKDLKKATDIFFSQNFKDESELNKWLEKLNPLQELEDYENINKVSLKKGLSADKIKDKMYSPQRIGEKFLQTRTMLAMLIKDGYMTSEGITTEKGLALTEDQLAKFSDKVQRVNQMIHGRYSSRDAAIVQQSALWRAAFQFKKWIPAAIESRIQAKHFDNRLGVEVEGRYRTYFKYWNYMIASLKNDQKALLSGQLTELDRYNMRKNITEIVIMAATVLSYFALGWDDDKQKKKNPYYKFAMNQLNRLSGDLRFFYNPSEMNRSMKSPFAISKTIGDTIDVLTTIPYAFDIEGSTYKKGIHKGENKFLASLLDITPGAKPVADIFRMGKDIPYEEPVKLN